MQFLSQYTEQYAVSESEILYSTTNIALRVHWQHCVPELMVTEVFSTKYTFHYVDDSVRGFILTSKIRVRIPSCFTTQNIVLSKVSFELFYWSC